MKKYYLALTLLLTALFLPAFALAQGGSETGGFNLTEKLGTVGEAANFGSEDPNLSETIGRVIQIFLLIVGTIFLLYTIYAGFKWIMARGNEEEVTKAKAIIRGCIIGIIVVLAAYAITSFVISQVGDAAGYQGDASGEGA